VIAAMMIVVAAVIMKTGATTTVAITVMAGITTESVYPITGADMNAIISHAGVTMVAMAVRRCVAIMIAMVIATAAKLLSDTIMVGVHATATIENRSGQVGPLHWVSLSTIALTRV
jgi:hypothetical protein